MSILVKIRYICINVMTFFVCFDYNRKFRKDPKFDKNTYILWLLPVLMFLVGGAIIFKRFIIKKN